MRASILFLVGFAPIALAQGGGGVRLLLGLTDTAETAWDGAATVRGARITSVEPWRFEGNDEIRADRSWRVSTHPIRLFGGQALIPRPVVANGVVVWLDRAGDDVELEVKTQQGAFSVRLGEIPFGTSKAALNGRAMAVRVPPSARLTDTADEQDYPAAAIGKDNTVWLAYLEFKHHPEHNRIRANLTAAPSSFDDWKAKPGGDQVFLRRFANGSWSEPIAITPPGGDLYRPAVAVDGTGRVWVFWSSNENGNFDLWTRSVANGRAADPVRITSEAGSDVFPAAATDSTGRAWVAWQAWRGGRAAILAATQQGDGFTKPAAVSQSSGNEWNPAIAASGDGRVTVVWDTYRAGNYDVLMRTASASGAWGKDLPVATTAFYEAYPSAAYDPGGRLWVAYEQGAQGWGKDFGADETSGVAIYQGRMIRLQGFERDGNAVEPASDPGGAMPGVPAQKADAPGRQSTAATPWMQPASDQYKSREASRPNPNAPAPKNTIPRLAVDPSGRLWLAFRSAHPIFWTTIGTVWQEHVASWDGKQWTGPILLEHSDNLLDNRPALIATAAGRLLVIGSSDSRRQFEPANRPRQGNVAGDPYQNDLFTSEITLPAAAGAAEVKPVAAAPRAGDNAAKSEAASIAAMRKARIRTAGGDLRVARGEFHRHSEISGDGGNDGTIIDQFRYIIDGADMDWAGCCDHDNGGGREYTWWTTQKLTDIFHNPGRYVAMFSYERSVPYPEGHRNTVFAQRGIRPLPRLPRSAEDASGPAPDTQMLYRYLKTFNGVVASHTSGTNMGTDWRDGDPISEPVVEIYQGERQNYEMPGAPRSNKDGDSIGGWRPKGFVSLALEMGYKMAFQASSDHISTHMSYCNVLARDLTREAVLEGFQKRHVYGATDNILADFRSAEHIMGDAFETKSPPSFRVKLVGTAPFAKVHFVRNNQYVYSVSPGKAEVDVTWRDASPVEGKTSYYYVRGEQQDGEIVWVSPMWVTYRK